MNALEKILEAFPEETFLKADGLDHAVIGMEYRSMRLIYSQAKIIQILMEEMTYEDAVEFYEFNIAGSYMGDKTPIFNHDLICQDF